MTENEISEKVIGAALKVHGRLGPGLLESAYEECLYYELINAGLSVEKQKGLPLIYDEVHLDCG
jgi:GxxExxY protein